MKKYIRLVMIAALALAFGALPLVAQTTGVHGVCKDQEGKPITDGVIDIVNTDSGRKMSAKTDKNGEYRMIGLTPGTYNATLSRAGKQVDAVNRIPVGMGDNASVDFDLKKDQAKAGPSEEDLRKQQEVQKQNEKIKGLNAKLAEARDLEKAGNYDQAISILQEATTTDPSKDLLWAYLGEAYRGAKKYPEAADAYQKALAIAPNNVSYEGGLADAYAKSGQVDKAIATYEAAAQQDPTKAAVYYFNEGAVYTNANKTDEAIAAYKKAIQADPTRADSYYLMAQNMVNKGQLKGDKMVVPDGTAEAFNKYLELDPNGKYAELAKQMLTAIGAPVETNFGKQKSAPAAKKKPN
jgi:tetratricopeptide (TPR) repeat protein